MIKLIILTLGIAFCSYAQSYDSKENIENAINNISAKPSSFVNNNLLLIIHPLIKDREIEFEIKADLNWNGDSCIAVYTSYKQLKGKTAKNKIEEGMSYPYNFPLFKIKQLLSENKFTGWVYSDSLKLNEGIFNGYKSKITENGMEKNFEVLLRNNRLYAISKSFDTKGISHAENTKESANVLFFDGKGKNLRLAKVYTFIASKKNSVPTINKKTTTYLYK